MRDASDFFACAVQKRGRREAHAGPPETHLGGRPVKVDVAEGEFAHDGGAASSRPDPRATMASAMTPHEAPNSPPSEPASAVQEDSAHAGGSVRSASNHEHAPRADALVDEWLGHLERKEIARAIPKVLQSLDASAVAPEEVRLPVNAILDLLAELAASGDAIRAREITRAVRRWVWVTSKDGLSSAEFARWTLLDELARVEPHLSHQLYQTFGKLIQTEDPELLQVLARYHADRPAEAKRDHDWLQAVAPALAQSFGGFLQPVEVVSPRQQRSARGWLLLIGVIIGLNVLRMFHESQTDDRALPEDRHPASGGRFEVVEMGGEVDATIVDRERGKLSSWLRRSGQTERAHQAAEALLHGSCDETERALSALDESARGIGGDADESMRNLWTEFARKCPGRTTPNE